MMGTLWRQSGLRNLMLAKLLLLKKKKTSRGRPRKCIQGESLTTGNTNQVYSGNSSQISHAPKKQGNVLLLKKKLLQTRQQQVLTLVRREKVLIQVERKIILLKGKRGKRLRYVILLQRGRLLSNPAEHNESFKLELSGAWKPPNS